MTDHTSDHCAFLTILCVALAGCGGLPIPTPGAIQCADNVWIEAGSKLTCPYAINFVREAEIATGIEASEAGAIEFVTGWNLGRFGFPQAIGETRGSDIAVIDHQASSLVHEFLHLHDKSHCNWSTKYLALFDQYAVQGAFSDDCAHVRCSSTHLYAVDGQDYGNDYQCVAE